MFWVRINILNARSLNLTKIKSLHHAGPLMPNAISGLEWMLGVLNGTEFNCSSVFGLTKYVHVPISVVSTG